MGIKEKLLSIIKPQHNDGFSYRRNRNYKRLIPIVIIVLFFGLAVYKISRLSNSSASEQRIEVQDAKATQELSKEFQFSLNNADGEEVGKIKFVVENAELRDEIIVKGQRATSVEGRTFLILNLKITNEFNQAIEITTRDYIRVAMNGNTAELLAPDIHNDPVEIQAISTKYTRVGFAINDTDKDLILLVGEIQKEKQQIPLKLN